MDQNTTSSGSSITTVAGSLRSDPERAEILERERIEAILNQIGDGELSAGDGLKMLTSGREKFKSEVRKEEQSHGVTLEVAMASAMEASARGDKGIMTGFPSIDSHLRGFKPGQLVTLSGETGKGKSALALCIALNMAKAGKAVAFYSLEMTREELAWRALSVLSKIPIVDLQTQGIHIEGRELEDYHNALELMKTLPFSIYDSESNTHWKIIDSIEKNQPDIAIIDHLHLLAGGNENKVQDVDNMARDFKTCAMRNRIPILLLCQLRKKQSVSNSQRMSGSSSPPVLDDIAWSVAISQHSNVVMFVWDQVPNDRLIRVIIAKNRGGSDGAIDMFWWRECTMFCEGNPLEGYD